MLAGQDNSCLLLSKLFPGEKYRQGLQISRDEHGDPTCNQQPDLAQWPQEEAHRGCFMEMHCVEWSIEGTEGRVSGRQRGFPLSLSDRGEVGEALVVAARLRPRQISIPPFPF